MVEYEYPQRVVCFLMEKPSESFKTIEINSFESYFGRDSSDK